MQTINMSNYTLKLVHGGELLLGDLPDRAIALDGAVQGPVMGDEKDRWSFDHHAGCARLITDATCVQVRRALLLGLNVEGREVFVNDLDADTIFTLWLLEAPHAALSFNRVRQLVRGVGAVDAHGPSGYLELGEEEAAITRVFFSKLYGVLPRDAGKRFEEWPDFVKASLSVVSNVLDGDCDYTLEAEASAEFEVLFEGKINGVSAALVKGRGFGPFEPLYRQGVSLVIVTNGEGLYTVGKTSDLVKYQLGPHTDPESLLGRLRAREDGWGGGSTIGGSPRPGGSALAPEDVWELLKS